MSTDDAFNSDLANSGPVIVWLIDDEKEFSQCVCEFINQSKEVRCVRCFSSALIAIQALIEGLEPPDVFLLDINMPDMSGLDAIVPLKQVAPSSRILILTAIDNDMNIRIATERGADGYTLKSPRLEKVLPDVCAAHRGAMPMDPEVVRRLVEIFQLQSVTEHRHNLTGREIEIIRHHVKGLVTKEVGEALGISASTVETHFKNIYRKLDVHTRSELTSKALNLKLI
jgi:DNA-binding NarL/FixJ family response regulator